MIGEVLFMNHNFFIYWIFLKQTGKVSHEQVLHKYQTFCNKAGGKMFSSPEILGCRTEIDLDTIN